MGQAVPGNVGCSRSRRRSSAQSPRIVSLALLFSIAGSMQGAGLAGQVPLHPSQPGSVRVGQVTAVAWPQQLALATDLALRANSTTEWPGLGRRPPGPLQLILVPNG